MRRGRDVAVIRHSVHDSKLDERERWEEERERETDETRESGEE